MTSTVSEARVKRAFATFDYNNKGHITHDELERILRALGLRGVSKQLVATFMRTTSTRKNPSEVTFNDCLRIIQNSGYDHVFEESFQVCQVLDKAESGRILPEAMMKAAKTDGRFDAYVDPRVVPLSDSTSASNSPHTAAAGMRRSSLTSINGPLFSRSAGASLNTNTATSVAGTAEGDVCDDELTAGSDRRRLSITKGGILGIPSVNLSQVRTTNKAPLAPASAKRQRLFNQIHRFVSRADDYHAVASAYAPTSLQTLLSSMGVSSGVNSNNTVNNLAASQTIDATEHDPALTFDEWRHVQASSDKIQEENKRRRRGTSANGQPPSLAGTVRGSSGINTPRGMSTPRGISMTVSTRFSSSMI